MRRRKWRVESMPAKRAGPAGGGPALGNPARARGKGGGGGEGGKGGGPGGGQPGVGPRDEVGEGGGPAAADEQAAGRRDAPGKRLELGADQLQVLGRERIGHLDRLGGV